MIVVVSNTACSPKTVKFKWADIKLGSLLPEPQSNIGEVHTNTRSELWIEVARISEGQYEEYIEQCKEIGFTIDSEESGSSFEAFNEDGYKLSLSYYAGHKELSIELEEPMNMAEFQWPDSDIAALLPVPESNIGSISREAADGFSIYIGETTREQYNQYVNKCKEAGFAVDYRKGDDYYYADNDSGYDLTLRYEGNNIMYIRIDEPDDAEDTNLPEQENSPDTESSPAGENIMPEVSASQETPASIDGIRPEFQETMDSYEAFFDEYAEFMSKYANSENPYGMLSDYLDFLNRYAEAMEKLDGIDTGTLSEAEKAYYLEVMGRITDKLLSIEY